MKYQFYNANPLQRRVNDCTVRAISLALEESWDDTYLRLSDYAQREAIMPDEVQYIDGFLDDNFILVYGKRGTDAITVREFVDSHPVGTYLITMNGHITCCKDGCIYDTFNPGNKVVWEAYRV